MNVFIVFETNQETDQVSYNKIIEKLLETEASIDRTKCVFVFGEHTGNVFFDKIRSGGLLSAYGYLDVSNRKNFRVFFLHAE